MDGDLEKQKETMHYLESLGQMSDDTQVLSSDFAPAKRMKSMKARSGMRVKFEDDNGNGVNPGYEYTIAAYEMNPQPSTPGDVPQMMRP